MKSDQNMSVTVYTVKFTLSLNNTLYHHSPIITGCNMYTRFYSIQYYHTIHVRIVAAVHALNDYTNITNNVDNNNKLLSIIVNH